MLTKAQRRVRLWREIIYDTRDGVSDETAQARLRLLQRWEKDAWAYLTGVDLDGRPIIWTTDELDEEKPIKPFPGHRPYLEHITRQLWAYRLITLDKVRQMYATTLCALNIDWYCSFVEEREVFVSRVTEESAVKLINDKIRVTHTRKPAWLQAALPMDDKPQKIITYLHTNSQVTGVAQNFAASGGRGPTGSIVMVDEAAFQDQFPAIYTAVLPMTGRLWAISTANVANPGALLFRKLIREGRPGLSLGEQG